MRIFAALPVGLWCLAAAPQALACGAVAEQVYRRGSDLVVQGRAECFDERQECEIRPSKFLKGSARRLKGGAIVVAYYDSINLGDGSMNICGSIFPVRAGLYQGTFYLSGNDRTGRHVWHFKSDGQANGH